MAFNSNYCFSGIIMITSIGFFNFLIGKNDIGPNTTAGPSSTYIHAFIITLVPAVRFLFFSNISLADSKISDVLALTSGIILILGMLYITNLIPSLNDVDLPWWFANSPWIFGALGIMLLTIGYFNLRMGQIYSIKTIWAIKKKERIC
jgi:hypothetical protein